MYFKSFFKKTQFLILLMALLLPWAAKAQEELTVCDGTASGTTTTTCNYVPLYGSYVDTQGTTSEFIIPSDTEGMDALVGGTISKLTFYITNSPASWGSPTIQVYIGEVEETILNSLYGPTNFTVVATSVLSNTQPTLEVELENPYTYEGGNLLIGTYVQTKSSTYKTTTFAGITAPYGSSRNNSGSGSGTAREFLPKTTFTYIPSGGTVCQKPSMETPSDVTSHSATISWTGGSGTFNVEYKKASEEEWTSRATNYNDYSVELNGLESSTTYQVQVQSICEDEALSKWASTSFNTPCESVETFPFHEDFNDLTTNGEIPLCWNNEEGTTTNENYRWCYNSSYGTGHEGKCVRFDSYSNSSGLTNFLKTPVLTLPQDISMQLRFWCKNPKGGDFSVYISTDGGATHETALITGLTGITEWTEETIDLSEYKGEENVVIVFKGTSNFGSNDARLYLDDVYIEEAPSCPKQNGLHIAELTSSSVTLDWTAGTNDQDHWDIFITEDENVTPDANTTPTVANTDQKPYTYSELNPETVYFAFVRARCSDTDQSPWTDACRFVTPQIPVTVDTDHPYDNDFETTCGWLFVNGDRPNQWWHGSAANNTANGEKAIYISNDGGESNTYTNTKSVVYATKAFAFAEGVYNFSYDWRAKGNQYYDYIRVALAPAAYEIVATENLPTGLSDTQLPTGWIALDGGSKLNNSDVWNTKVANEIQVPAGEYKMVVVWRNMTYTITQPPAAIDNVSISLATCPTPQLSFVANSNTAYTGSVTWTGNAESYEIAYRPTSDFNPSDYTLEDVTRIHLGSVSEYTLQDLTPETKYYIYVQGDCGSEDGKSPWSNRVIFTTLATCLAPSYLTDESVGSTSVNLSWTKGADDQDAWQFRYKKTSDSDYSYVLVENHPENTYELTGLEPATSYYVNVRAWCGGDDYSKWSLANQSSDKTITTECAALMLPYTCDFEGEMRTDGHFSSYPVPKCWDRIEMQYGSYSPYSYYPYVYNYSTDAHGGTKSLRMYRTPNSANQTIILPEIDDQYNKSLLQVRFWAKSGSSNNTLSVGVIENNVFTEVQLVEGISTTYAEYTVFFEGYTGTARNIAIKCGSSSGYLYYYIDDLSVEVAPTCRIPKNLEATVAGESQATLTWIAGRDETAWNVQLKQASANNWGEMFETDEPTFTFENLKRATEYDARVRAICSADDQSDWIETSFTTDCGVWPIDINNALFEDFDGDDFPPACWNWIRVSNYYGWQYSSGQYNPLDPTGAAYSYWPNGETYLILPHMHIDGDAELNFDMLFQGDGSGQGAEVVLSTTGYDKLNYTNTLWTAAEFPSSKTNVTVGLSDYDDQDVYIAFKYIGVGTGGRTWYVDNVQVNNTNSSISSTVSLGYGTGNGNWYLISSPLAGEIDADDVVNMTNCDFDLYRFNQDSNEEWENWKTVGSEHRHFNLESGRGYLYANREKQKITFVGEPYDGNGEVTLKKTEGQRLAGWNLIGNPYTTPATVDKDFYRMNEEGTGFIAAEDNVVGLMEGIMVYAASDGEIATFTANSSKRASTEQIVIDLTHNEGKVIDRVVVRFGEGGKLPKYSFGNSNAKVYIPQYDYDYAVVRSNAFGDVPVNFSTAETAKYTFNVSVKTSNASYLHLIDKLTGDDVDLLEENNYTFVGSPRDDDDRFVLRFSNNADASNDIFAYQNGNEIIVSGEGELQVFDVMGRLISTQHVNGIGAWRAASVQTGVYVFKLNGKTQKIIVR